MIPASFDADDRHVVTAAGGQRVHAATVTQMERLKERLYAVRDGVWCLVGNGLSNQTFVEGPEGLIVVDTGESREEMAAALAAVREHTDAPVAAVIYTHFHYCNGTTAAFEPVGDTTREHRYADAAAVDAVPIWGHERIAANLRRIGGEVAPVAGRGLVHQFGMLLPDDGPDGLVGCGLGRFYRNPEHGRGTAGHLPVTHPVSEPTTATIAGLTVELTPAPSDADDNLNLWFPDLGLCINNLVWPALFNVFAIRGEEYRDPQVLLTGFDEIAAWEPDHLLCTHGPPISGRDEIRAGVIDARDAVQYLWDQTVRHINRGLTVGEVIDAVQLPQRFERSYLTQQHYGLVEHHVRQIHAGLRGWFDGYEAELFPVPTAERTRRLIAGFGGRDAVLDQARSALDDGDLRWALELSTWLVRSETTDTGRADGGSDEERSLLADVLRTIAQRTRSANIRNWCLTRALELEGRIDLGRFRGFRTSRGQVLAGGPEASVRSLRVTLDPERAEGIHHHIAFELDGTRTGLRLRDGVAVPTDGRDADHVVSTAFADWAEALGGRTTLVELLANGRATVTPDAGRGRLLQALACFEVPAFEQVR